MSSAEQHASDEPANDDTTTEHHTGGMSGRTTDVAGGRKTARPKVTLSAIVACPRCGNANKPEWLNKSRHGDSYANTIFCEQCGSLITVWAMHVDAQIVAHSEDG